MKINESSPLSPGPAAPASSPSLRGPSFMDQLKKATDAAAVEKIKDTLELAKDGASLQALRGLLTPASKAVLDRIQAGRDDITQDEWTGLCKELKSLGAISESDFQYTRADLDRKSVV